MLEKRNTQRGGIKMNEVNIQIIDEESVVEDQLRSEEEAMDRYLELIEEEFEFVGTVKIIQLLREIY